MDAGIVLSLGAAAVAYISCEAAERLKLADSAKLFALTFLLVTFGAQDGISKPVALHASSHLHALPAEMPAMQPKAAHTALKQPHVCHVCMLPVLSVEPFFLQDVSHHMPND